MFSLSHGVTEWTVMLKKLLLSISAANGGESMLNDRQMKKIWSSVIARGDVLFGALF